MSNRNKVKVAKSRGVYTVYAIQDDLFNERVYDGTSQTEMIKNRKALAAKYHVKAQQMPYEIIGKRRTLVDAVSSFAEDHVCKVRKDLTGKALEIIGETSDTVSIVFNGPFAYIRKKLV